MSKSIGNGNNSINSKSLNQTYAPIKKRLDGINITNVCTVSGCCILDTHDQTQISAILRSIIK